MATENIQTEMPARYRDVLGNGTVSDLKGRSVRGGVAAVSSQGLKLLIQAAQITILSHLLAPKDFGIQSMIVTMTGFLGLFRDGGLGLATVQREVITHEQTSTLFWINLAVGIVLAGLAACAAPFLVFFYKDSRLLWATAISGLAFVFNGLAAQHQALLVRRLRFMTMAITEVLTIAGGTTVAVVMASMGFGYWSLVAMAVSGPAISAIALWIAVPWRPAKPKRTAGVRSMLNYGGAVTGDTVVIYFGYNTEKFLLGRFFGAATLGLYTRAFQLLNLPLQQLNSSFANIVIPALSRIQNDPERVRRFFLKSYSLLLSVCLPVTLSSALFADDIISVFLGPQWTGSVIILRLLAPTIVAFALINPFGWFLLATGRAVRNFLLAFMVAPTVVLGIVLGLPYGAAGVAAGYSAAMVLLIVPVLAWATRDTGITAADIWNAIKAPILSGIAAAIVGLLFAAHVGASFPQILRLALGLLCVAGTYALTLLFGMRQWKFYRDLAGQFAMQRFIPGGRDSC